MKIKTEINKEYTTVAQVPQVKKDLKEFTEIYTVGDLSRMFWQAAERDDIRKITAYDHLEPQSTDCIKCTVTGYPGGSDYNNETCYDVNMTFELHDHFIKIQYYIGPDLLPGPMIMYSFGQRLEMFEFKLYNLQA